MNKSVYTNPHCEIILVEAKDIMTVSLGEGDLPLDPIG